MDSQLDISDEFFVASDSSLSDKQEEAQVPSEEQQAKSENMTPETIIELTEENISCQICYKYALNPSNCSSQKCKKLFCNSCVTNTKNNLEDKCPFCRSEPFQVQKSPYARQINRMELICLLCKEKYILEREEKHYKQDCSFFHKIQCRYCDSRLEKSEVVAHTRQFHAQKIDEIIFNLYNTPPPQHGFRELLAKHKVYFEKLDKRPQLGTTGKFYCGGRLQTKCTCCNGQCGPTNGENCVQCMKLDIKRYGLEKGYLVNSGGMICFKSGNDFICGARLYYEQGHCSQNNTCRACTNMKKNIKRYQALM